MLSCTVYNPFEYFPAAEEENAAKTVEKQKEEGNTQKSTVEMEGKIWFDVIWFDGEPGCGFLLMGLVCHVWICIEEYWFI